MRSLLFILSIVENALTAKCFLSFPGKKQQDTVCRQVWDQFADKSQGLPVLQNSALRDIQYITSIIPQVKTT